VLLEMTQSVLGKQVEGLKELTTVVLETKSSLGLDCRNTERLYTGTSAHGPRLLGEVLLVVMELSVSS